MVNLLKDFGAWKKKNKSADVIWSGFDVICVLAWYPGPISRNMGQVTTTNFYFPIG